MNGENTPNPMSPEERRPAQHSRVARALGHFGSDVTVAVVWAALIVAIVLFSGVVSQFAYVDF